MVYGIPSERESVDEIRAEPDILEPEFEAAESGTELFVFAFLAMMKVILTAKIALISVKT